MAPKHHRWYRYRYAGRIGTTLFSAWGTVDGRYDEKPRTRRAVRTR